MNDWIEQERIWEQSVRKQNRENIVKWLYLVIGILCLVMLLLVASTPSQGQTIENPRSQRLVDWSFVTAHGIYAGASAFDWYETANHVGVCASEGNPDLGLHPSTRSIVTHATVEFGAVVAGDLLLKLWLRHQQVPHWLNNSMSTIGASIGTVKHVHGGMEWVNLCH